MTSASDEKWRSFNGFFRSGQAKDLSAPLCIEKGGFMVCRPVTVYWLNCIIETTKVTGVADTFLGDHVLEVPNVFSVDPLGFATTVS
jgi:hypothetical protein